MLKLSQKLQLFAAQGARLLQTTQVSCIDHEWRRKNRLTRNPNTESPLTCLPDFTYMDGRPTPLGRNQKRRLEKQRSIAKYIVKGLDEIHFAEKRYERIQREKAEEHNKVMDGKLRQKGFHLYKKDRQ